MATPAEQMKAPPKQVQAAARAATEIQNQLAGSETPLEDISTARDEDINALLKEVGEPAPERAETAAPPEPAPAAPAAEETPKREDWKQKYHVLRGKYDAEVPRLSSEVRDLKEDIAQLMAAPKPPEKVAEPTNLINPQEMDDYGPEFFDMIGRKAKEITEQEYSPIINSLRAEVDTLKGQLQSTGQRVQQTEQQTFYSQLDKRVENWREINTNAGFLGWLDTVIPETDGITRKQMLLKAFDAGDVNHVASFFSNYADSTSVPQENAPVAQVGGPAGAEQASTLSMEDLVAPVAGQGTSQGAPAEHFSQKIWTQAEIARFYRDSKDGKFKGRESDKMKIEAAIVKAVSQGRVR